MIILIPMAGLATRFAHEGISTPKPLIQVAGKPLIQHTIETLGLVGTYVFVTRRYDNPADNIALSLKLKELVPDCHELMLDHPTRGAVETCMMARDLLDPDEQLIITNCDQRTEWDAQAFLKILNVYRPDGLVVTHESKDPKHSYAEVEHSSGFITRIVEKQVISNHALVGIHYWRRAELFTRSAETLLGKCTVGRESYVSETYNYLIGTGRSVVAYPLAPNQYIPLGTPYDVAIYEGKLREYSAGKPRTLFLDLDGTILKHAHRYSDLSAAAPVLLLGVLDKMNQWDSEGHQIVLCTARKESARGLTERQLEMLGVPYDVLVMGLTSGGRVLVNDKLGAAHPDRATAINLITNGGFEGVDWKVVNL